VIAALDSTYVIGLPDSWFRWTAFLRFFGEIDWMNWVVPSECVIGTGMAQVLLLRALVPLAIIIAVPLVGACVFFIKQRAPSSDAPRVSRQQSSDLAANQGSQMSKALVHWLPFSLIIAFCFTPSLSASIFRAWQCLTFSYNDKSTPIEEHSFLAQDLDVRCDDSADYGNILVVAWVLVAIWPIGRSHRARTRGLLPQPSQMLTRHAPCHFAGMVVMYVVLLIPCRFALLDEAPAPPLLHATVFLHRDYRHAPPLQSRRTAVQWRHA
jgi:hypothetical protein